MENPRLEIEDHSDDDFQKTLEMLDKQSVPTKVRIEKMIVACT